MEYGILWLHNVLQDFNILNACYSVTFILLLAHLFISVLAYCIFDGLRY